MCRTGVLSFISESNDCSQRDEGARDPYETEKSSFGMKIQLYENRVESLNFQDYLLKTKQLIKERVETRSNDVHPWINRDLDLRTRTTTSTRFH